MPKKKSVKTVKKTAKKERIVKLTEAEAEAARAKGKHLYASTEVSAAASHIIDIVVKYSPGPTVGLAILLCATEVVRKLVNNDETENVASELAKHAADSISITVTTGKAQPLFPSRGGIA